MRKFIHKLQLKKLLKDLYKEVSFWQKFRSLKSTKEKKADVLLVEKLFGTLTGIEDLGLFIEYLEYEIVFYLKNMYFISEYDTMVNRAKLACLLNMKQKLEKAKKRTKLDEVKLPKE